MSGEDYVPKYIREGLRVPVIHDTDTGAVPAAILAYIARWNAGKVRNATIDESQFNTTTTRKPI